MERGVRRQVSAGGVIVRWFGAAKPEVALTAHKDLKGKMVWSLPKGLIEPGEAPEEAAIREVREETGLEGKVTRKVGQEEYWYYSPQDKTRIHKIVHFFLMECVGGDTSRHDWEVEEARWFPWDSAREALSYKGEREILDKVSPSEQGEDKGSK